MRVVPVRLAGRSYEVCLGRGLLGRLGDVPCVSGKLRGRAVFAVADRTVHRLLGERVEAGLRHAGASLRGWALLEPGEEHKDLASLSAVWDGLVRGGFERGDCLVALGGGVVGDVAGFAAATYHRGVDFIQLPTTVLAMADSSVGGKTAIDHPLGKNLIGSFHQPCGVAADLDVLETLPEREIRSGLAEVLKSALLADPALFERFASGGPERLRDLDFLEEAVGRAVAVKAQVVEQDEREGGPRALLNLGHTFGHAVEVVSGYGAYTHGEAVALGIAFAVRVSAAMGLLDGKEAARIARVLGKWGYCVKLPPLAAEKLMEALRLDKKSAGGAPRWVLLRAVGKPEWGREVPMELLKGLLDERTAADAAWARPKEGAPDRGA